MTSVSWITCFIRNNEFIDRHDDLWLGIDAILIPYICLVNDILLNIFLPETYQDRTSICLRISWNVSSPNCPAPADSVFAVPAATASPSASGQSPPASKALTNPPKNESPLPTVLITSTSGG